MQSQPVDTPVGDSALAAMYRTLSAVKEALLYADNEERLYGQVCEAAMSAGELLTAAIVTLGADGEQLKLDAVAGPFAAPIEDGRHLLANCGLLAEALRSGEAAFTVDVANDVRARPWRELGDGLLGMAALPLGSEGATTGALVLLSGRSGAFTDANVPALKRLADNVGFVRARIRIEAECRQTLQALIRKDDKHRDILESFEDAYYEVDLAGHPVHHNGAFFRMLGHHGEAPAVDDNRQFQTPEMAAALYKIFNEVYRTGTPRSGQQWAFLHKNGEAVHMEGSVHLVRDESGVPRGFRGIMRDVTERRRMDQALRASEERFRALTNLSSDWYWEQDPDFRFQRMDSRHAQTGEAPHPLLGQIIWNTPFDVQAKGGWEGFRKMMAAREVFRDVILHRQLPDGRPYYLSLSGEPLFDAAGQFLGYRGISKEITEQKVAEEQIQYLARHDVLTGLPNRLTFSNLLNLVIPDARYGMGRFVVLFIDIDRFKFINDTLGHEAGDDLLKQIATRFRQALRTSDVISRLGSDEFVVLVQNVSDREQAKVVATKLLHSTLRPFTLLGQECRVTASIGAAMFPDDGEDEHTLMKNADGAMSHAKEEGKNNFQFYSREHSSQSLERLALEVNLRAALERGEFTLNYQARVDLKTQVITGVEALLRWHNPVLGSVSPTNFIPVAESTGLIVPIGLWVLHAACRQNMAWQRLGLPPISMAVNISARQFSDESLVADITAILAETGMAASLLELEITEGMIIHHMDRAIALLTKIKAMGVRLAIDDFGTGYSSLGQLKRFPIDTLKVDRSFVRDLATDSEDQAITTAIIAMGKTLSLTVVAEGVETLEQQTFLCEHGCDEMQGYYFSQPIAADAFAALYKRHLTPFELE